MAVTTLNEASTLVLPTSLDIAGSRDLQAALRPLLDSQEVAHLDASKVERVDAAGLQLLTAFVRRARSAEVSVVWRGVSAELKAAAAMTGLTFHLGLEA